MAAFNAIQKKRRAKTQERKRELHGDPHTGKLKQRAQPTVISGKRKRKLLRKWQREQKDVIQKGLVTLEDVEMAVAEGSSEKPQNKFHLKKTKLQIKRLKGKGKGK